MKPCFRKKYRFSAVSVIAVLGFLAPVPSFADTSFVQYAIPFTVFHKNKEIWSSVMIFNTSDIRAQHSWSSSLDRIAYPEVVCATKGSSTTRTFKSAILSNGFSADSRLVNNGKSIAITIKKMQASPVTKQVMLIMKQPISACKTVMPKQLTSINRTITTLASDHVGVVDLGNGYRLKYSISSSIFG
ncbi:hypothetical protein HF673_03040 [Acidithiobacillus thiooxidans]|uniref:Uncharacterized protein n=1 Tax=Acidithiobacillus thiooxidans ATCC 19377 TaxID=637390 RepID=A0A5P9XRM6_ACITH|nr:hypothetical protein [Acidithiobacillus thiooxidans]MBU2834785.1 hypothetical protein [Acidithiobacillus thiooxidans]QFX96671.1 hypothetical protein GCD22_02481 [Acidithiobacillus thiooxidans ATCC 19377]